MRSRLSSPNRSWLSSSAYLTACGPAWVGLELACRYGVTGMIRAGRDKGAEWPGSRPGLARDAFTGVKRSSAFSRTAWRRIGGVLFAGRVPADGGQPGSCRAGRRGPAWARPRCDRRSWCSRMTPRG